MFLKDLEAIRPSAIIDIIHSGESFVLEQSVQKGMKAMRKSSAKVSCNLLHPTLMYAETCLRCGYMSSNDLCVCHRPLPSLAYADESRKLVLCSKASNQAWSDPPSCVLIMLRKAQSRTRADQHSARDRIRLRKRLRANGLYRSTSVILPGSQSKVSKSQ